MKNIKLYEEYHNDDFDFENKDIDDYTHHWFNYVVEKLNNLLGGKIIGNNADWGGLWYWKLQNSDYVGFFVVMDDDLTYLERKYTEDYDTVDREIYQVDEGDDITELLKIVKIDSTIKKFNI